MYTRSKSRHDPSYCFPVQRYYSSRTTKSHSKLTGIEVRLVGCTTLYQMRYLAGEVRAKRPKGPVYRDALGGSSHGANFTSGEAWAYLQALLAAVNVRFGMAAIHTSAYGRMDFHFLAVDDDGTGRSLAGSGQSFARRLRLASIELVTQLNLQRLREGRFVIANLTPKGRVYWMRERERLVKDMELNGIVPNWESSNERPCLFPWDESRLELEESKSEGRQKAEPKAPKKSVTGPSLKPVTEVLAKPLEKCSEKPEPDPGEMPAEEKLAVLGKLDLPATLPGDPAPVEASTVVSEARAVIKDAQQLKAIMTTVHEVLVGSDRLLQPLGDTWWTASVQVQFPERPTVKRYLEDCVARLRCLLDAKPLSWELQRRSLTETLARIEARVKTETLDVGAATVVVVTHPPAGPVAVEGAEDDAPKSPGLATNVPDGAGEPSTLLPVVVVDKGSAPNLAAVPVQPEAADQTPTGDERFTSEKELVQVEVDRESAEDRIRMSVAIGDGLTRADVPPVPAANLAKAAGPLNPPNPESVEGAALVELGRLVGEITAARRPLLLLAAAARNGNRIERSAVLADGSTRLDTFLQTQLQRIDELLKQCPNLGENEAKVVSWARKFAEPEQGVEIGGVTPTAAVNPIKLPVVFADTRGTPGDATIPLIVTAGVVATISIETPPSDQSGDKLKPSIEESKTLAVPSGVKGAQVETNPACPPDQETPPAPDVSADGVGSEPLGALKPEVEIADNLEKHEEDGEPRSPSPAELGTGDGNGDVKPSALASPQESFESELVPDDGSYDFLPEPDPQAPAPVKVDPEVIAVPAPVVADARRGLALSEPSSKEDGQFKVQSSKAAGEPKSVGILNPVATSKEEAPTRSELTTNAVNRLDEAKKASPAANESEGTSVPTVDLQVEPKLQSLEEVIVAEMELKSSDFGRIELRGLLLEMVRMWEGSSQLRRLSENPLNLQGAMPPLAKMAEFERFYTDRLALVENRLNNERTVSVRILGFVDEVRVRFNLPDRTVLREGSGRVATAESMEDLVCEDLDLKSLDAHRIELRGLLLEMVRMWDWNLKPGTGHGEFTGAKGPAGAAAVDANLKQSFAVRLLRVETLLDQGVTVSPTLLKFLRQVRDRFNLPDTTMAISASRPVDRVAGSPLGVTGAGMFLDSAAPSQPLHRMASNELGLLAAAVERRATELRALERVFNSDIDLTRPVDCEVAEQFPNEITSRMTAWDFLSHLARKIEVDIGQTGGSTHELTLLRQVFASLNRSRYDQHRSEAAVGKRRASALEQLECEKAYWRPRLVGAVGRILEQYSDLGALLSDADRSDFAANFNHPTCQTALDQIEQLLGLFIKAAPKPPVPDLDVAGLFLKFSIAVSGDLEPISAAHLEVLAANNLKPCGVKPRTRSCMYTQARHAEVHARVAALFKECLDIVNPPRPRTPLARPPAPAAEPGQGLVGRPGPGLSEQPARPVLGENAPATPFGVPAVRSGEVQTKAGGSVVENSNNVTPEGRDSPLNVSSPQDLNAPPAKREPRAVPAHEWAGLPPTDAELVMDEQFWEALVRCVAAVASEGQTAAEQETEQKAIATLVRCSRWMKTRRLAASPKAEDFQHLNVCSLVNGELNPPACKAEEEGSAAAKEFLDTLIAGQEKLVPFNLDGSVRHAYLPKTKDGPER